jgi:hypothetical protein
MELPGVDHPAQQLAPTEQMLLADKLVQGEGAHPLR